MFDIAHGGVMIDALNGKSTTTQWKEGNNMRFAYVQFLTPDGMGYVCFANEGTKVAAAFCSPRDRFDKKIARNISAGRIAANRCYDVPVVQGTGYNQTMLTYYLENGLLPSWALRALREDMFEFTLSQKWLTGEKLEYLPEEVENAAEEGGDAVNVVAPADSACVN